MTYSFVERLTVDQAEQLCEMFQAEWWTKGRKLEDVKTMLRHTDYVFGLVEVATDGLIGFARVMSDRVYKALIMDVMISPSYRQQGIGRELMNLIQGHPELRRVQHFELYCLEEMVPFYEKWGFSTNMGAATFMRRHNDL